VKAFLMVPPDLFASSVTLTAETPRRCFRGLRTAAVANQ
jgi:hypothetical protein